jgi:hypothetical protein
MPMHAARDNLAQAWRQCSIQPRYKQDDRQV